MGTKVPSDVFSGNAAGDDLIVERGIQEKEAWQYDRADQGNPTADVVRVTETGGDTSAGIEPTYTAVSGLSGLLVAVYEEVRQLEYKYGGLYEAGDREFTFYDVEVQSTDRIDYDGDSYKPVTVEFESETGRCDVLGRKVAD